MLYATKNVACFRTTMFGHKQHVQNSKETLREKNCLPTKLCLSMSSSSFFNLSCSAIFTQQKANKPQLAIKFQFLSAFIIYKTISNQKLKIRSRNLLAGCVA